MEKRNNKKLLKYRFVTKYEPSFPDIRKAFRKFDHILKNDEKNEKSFSMWCEAFSSI